MWGSRRGEDKVEMGEFEIRGCWWERGWAVKWGFRLNVERWERDVDYVSCHQSAA
jgi:hypothetical protein